MNSPSSDRLNQPIIVEGKPVLGKGNGEIMKTKHVGVNALRLSREPLEKAYADAWAETAPNTLGYLICGQDKNFHDYSQRDATVAATIIQWLGSPVGSEFVASVKREATR